MPVPANLSPRPDLVVQFLRSARRLRLLLVAFNLRAGAAAVPTTAILEVLEQLRGMRDQIDALPSSDGFRDAAQALLEDGGYLGDIRADAAALRQAIVAAGNAIAGAGGTIWQGYAIDAASWAEILPSRSPAQTQTLRQLLDAVIATVAGP